MIFYFSGTGNSRWAAEELARRLKDKAVLIPKAKEEYKLSANEKSVLFFRFTPGPRRNAFLILSGASNLKNMTATLFISSALVTRRPA